MNLLIQFLPTTNEVATDTLLVLEVESLPNLPLGKAGTLLSGIEVVKSISVYRVILTLGLEQLFALIEGS